MTRLDWALGLLTPMVWSLFYAGAKQCSIPDWLEGDEWIIANLLTLACWGVYLGWGRP